MFAILHDGQIVKNGNVFMIFNHEQDAIASIQTTYEKIGKIKIAPTSRPRQKIFIAPNGAEYTVQFLVSLTRSTHF